MLKINDFFEQCAQSTEAAVLEFSRLLKSNVALDLERLAQQLLQVFNAYQELKECKRQRLNFSFVTQEVRTNDDQTLLLKLIDFPSTYTPEEWSYTFYEGINRYSLDSFNDKKLIELGCGNGWISLAIALRFQPKKIIGLDINPNAILCSKLNAILNSIDEDGRVIRAEDDRSLFERTEFIQSDLLQECMNQGEYFDCVIGCIPQVLRPELSTLQKITQQEDQDEFLHSLSNYCEKQGYIEDEFGLGLIAKALEQAIGLIKPQGKIILNLGGRPGESVLVHMIERRGFDVKKVWQTRVVQAADTDIKSLVDIENTLGHDFEFYMDAVSDVPINANTALAYAESGKKIYHAVTVYEASLVFPQWVKKIYSHLEGIDEKQLNSALDLTPKPVELAEERVSFLANITGELEKWPCFPYEETAGLLALKKSLSQFIAAYYHTDFDQKDFIVSPSRADIISNLISVFEFGKILVNETLLKDYFDRNLESRSQWPLLIAPPRTDLTCELASSLKPDLILTRFADFEQSSTDAFERLLSLAAAIDTTIVIDISSLFELSSSPASTGLFQKLQEGRLPDNVCFVCGLINNKVYRDLKLSFFITKNNVINQALVNAAELTYSRTPFITQIYYTHLLRELLYFQRSQSSHAVSIQADVMSRHLVLKNCAQEAFSHPAIAGNALDFDSQSTRLDYGENELQSPELLKTLVLESFLRASITAAEADPAPDIREYFKARYAVETQPDQYVYGNGIAPLFNAIAAQCKREGAQLVFPSGAYGYFVACANMQGMQTRTIKTERGSDFKITVDDLKKGLQATEKHWLFLNLPSVNPTGAVYDAEEFKAIIHFCQAQGVTVVFDTAFSGLEFSGDSHLDMNLLNDTKRLRWFLLGGVAKEFAAGGLRFGFCTTSRKDDATHLRTHIPSRPHLTLNYTVRKLYQYHNEGDDRLVLHLTAQQNKLKRRSDELSACLKRNGWEVLSPQGGLFLVARPDYYLKEGGFKTASDVVTALFEFNGLAINNDRWTGLDEYCRFVLAVDDRCFCTALEKIESFYNKIKSR